MKHLQGIVPDEVIFKKGSFSWFWFSLKQILGLKRKHLSLHRLVLYFVTLLNTNMHEEILLLA